MWNRTQGDCLLDAVLQVRTCMKCGALRAMYQSQATYGVFDTDNMLRQALADSLRDAEAV